MNKILFFSNNKNKISEVNKLFKQFSINLISLNDLGFSEAPKENGKTCYGIDLRNHPELNRVNIDWLMQAFAHSNQPEAFFLDPGFRRHAGTSTLATQIKNGMSESEIRESWQSDINTFLNIRKKYLIYR